MEKARIIHDNERSLLESAKLAGNADWAMRQLAVRLEEKSRRRAEFCLMLLEPTLVMVSGGVVLWVGTSVLVPLLKLINDLS